MILEARAQTHQAISFIGGTPKLPPGGGIPRCALCGAKQTFFFQVAFPTAHEWSGLTLVVFSCTSCADEDHLIPEMLECDLLGADIPGDFLVRYQNNFRFEVFRTDEGQVVPEYDERIGYRRIRLDEERKGPSIGHVGGRPEWLMQDESPGTYDSSFDMCFLMQIDAGMEYAIIGSAPPQMDIRLSGEPGPSELPFYRLFLGNALYLFGTVDADRHLVYALTQVD